LRVHSALIRELDAELVAAHDLPLHSYEVLVHLDGAPGHRLRMSELARSVLVSASGVTRLVDRLEADGFVCRRRCDLDGRGYWAELTPTGAAKLTAARATHLSGVRRLFLAHLDAGERARLAKVWERILGGAAAP
jgi:DNA-binding MarR family transcriptional regulator